MDALRKLSSLYYMARSAIFFILFWVFTGCREHVDVSSSHQELKTTLDDLLDESLDGTFGRISGVAMSIMSPSLPDGSWTGSVGYDSREQEDELSTDQPFRVASITKTFVASAILRLHEMDSLSINYPIEKDISKRHQEILIKDGYDPSKILIRHCLNHTSGLFDYAANHDAYIDACAKEPNHRWTRTEQLEGAVKWGDKVGEPGELYRYSDTGYILLGETIESFYNGDLAQGLRVLLRFKQLGLNSTWLETLEPYPRNFPDPVHRYLGRLDATNFDASIDLYGGGGLMSTCQDLSLFIKALFNHEVYDKKETLSLMKTTPKYFATYNPSKDRRYKDYRYGLWKFLIYGEEAYMHGGIWGTEMIHIPALELSIAANFTSGRNDRLLKKAILAIKNARNQNQ